MPADERSATLRKAQKGSVAVATIPAFIQQQHQEVLHESACKGTSQDVGTQTDCPSEASSCNLHPEHPFRSAHPAEALAEGTRLLMATPDGSVTRHQHTTQLSAGLRAAPWTLLTQSNIQLRLKPLVAAAGTQTEDMRQSEEPSASTVATIDIAIESGATPQAATKSASVSAAQLATSAALPRPPQTSFPRETDPARAVSASRKAISHQQVPSPAKNARQASRYRRSPNAHLMFQCQVIPSPYATFAPGNSCHLQSTACLTPAQASELKHKRSSMSCLSPSLTTSAPQPAADAVVGHGQAATPAADPLEIQLADPGASCKSAIRSIPPVGAAPGLVKKQPSQVQPPLEAQALSGNTKSACLPSPPQSYKELALASASRAKTTKDANVSPSVHPDKSDLNNNAAGAAVRAAAAPRASHAPPSSKAAAAIKPSQRDSTPTIRVSPQAMPANVVDYPASTVKEPAQRRGQGDAQPTTHLVFACPAQPASRHSAALGGTLLAPKAPKAPTAQLVPLAVGAPPGQHQAADTSPGKPAHAPAPDSSTHKTAASSQQTKEPITATMTQGTPNATVADCSKAAIQTAPSSPSQGGTRGKSQIESQAKQQLDPPCTADALRSDLISTAGCHVTRRLVQHLLEPISQPAAGARACSRTNKGTAGEAGHSMARAAQLLASKVRASGHSPAAEAGRAASGSTAQANGSSQPPQATKATGAQASTTSRGQVRNADHSRQAHQSKQAGKEKHNPPEPKAVSVKERQRSMPPLPSPTESAAQPKAAVQKATDASPEARHASRAKAAKTCSMLELKQQQTVPAAAINPATNRKKTGSSTVAGKQQAPAVKVVNTTAADKEKAGSGSKVTACGASNPSWSVSESKESHPSSSSASKAQSSLKRLRLDAAVASAPAKRPKVRARIRTGTISCSLFFLLGYVALLLMYSLSPHASLLL